MHICFKIIKFLLQSMSLYMFRTPLCPSSGAFHHCTCSLWLPCDVVLVAFSSPVVLSLPTAVTTQQGWKVRGSNPGRGGEIFRTPIDRPRGLPSLLYNGYRVFPGGKAAGAWRWPPTLSSAEVKERVVILLLPLRAFMPGYSVKFVLPII
jgi:hypothetical protein